LLGAAAVVIGYATAPSSKQIVPAATARAPSPALVYGTVQSRDNSVLRLTTPAGPRDLKVTAGTVFERLEPATLVGMSVGDWINVGAVPNKQTLFAMTGVVVISPDRLQGGR